MADGTLITHSCEHGRGSEEGTGASPDNRPPHAQEARAPARWDTHLALGEDGSGLLRVLADAEVDDEGLADAWGGVATQRAVVDGEADVAAGAAALRVDDVLHRVRDVGDAVVGAVRRAVEADHCGRNARAVRKVGEGSRHASRSRAPARAQGDTAVGTQITRRRDGQ